MKSESFKGNEVEVSTGNEWIKGNLEIPKNAGAIVLFAHGSGSSRFSPRNMFVSKLLNRKGIATFLVDLLTPKEESIDNFTGQYRFDVNLLAQRLIDSSRWLKANPQTASFSVGYYGASTGAAAALIAAAKYPENVKAIVSRGGRPDLAGAHLTKVQAPTLLIVGGNDIEVIVLNKEALSQIHVEKRLSIVPGATHLFEEPGTLQKAAELAIDWFMQHL